MLLARKIFYKNMTNKPYLSTDSISELFDYHPFGRDGKSSIDTTKLMKSLSLYVNSEKLETLLSNFGNFINAKVIATGNSDFNFTKEIQLPKSVSLWISQNNILEYSNGVKVIPLPIGIENLRLGRSGLPPLHIPQSKFLHTQKVLIPPMAPSNPQRKLVIEAALKNSEIFEVRNKYLSEQDYFKLTRDFRFVFSCEGNGFENHRTWETLYRNAFPVMLRSNWSISLQRLGLPILVIDDLESLTGEILRNFLKQNYNFNAINYECLWTPFWKEKIQEVCFSSN